MVEEGEGEGDEDRAGAGAGAGEKEERSCKSEMIKLGESREIEREIKGQNEEG